MRWLPRIFNHTVFSYQAANWWDLSPSWITLWLIGNKWIWTRNDYQLCITSEPIHQVRQPYLFYSILNQPRLIAAAFAAAFAWNVLAAISEYHVWIATCKVSKYGVFSGLYFPAFSCIFSRSGSRNSCPYNLKVWHMDLLNFGGQLMVLVVQLTLNSPNN